MERWKEEIEEIAGGLPEPAGAHEKNGQVYLTPGVPWSTQWDSLLFIALPTAEIIDRERLIASMGNIRLFPLVAIDDLVGLRFVYSSRRSYGESKRTVRFAKGKVSIARIKAALSDLQAIDGQYILQRQESERRMERHRAFLERIGGSVPRGAFFNVDSISISGLEEWQAEEIAKAAIAILQGGR